MKTYNGGKKETSKIRDNTTIPGKSTFTEGYFQHSDSSHHGLKPGQITIATETKPNKPIKKK